ncbi:MAG: hypothetical protein M3256_27005, partial [Actinomycetota bacterium]|nr:hypothetical protein [Actinomycetota bacterium]
MSELASPSSGLQFPELWLSSCSKGRGRPVGRRRPHQQQVDTRWWLQGLPGSIVDTSRAPAVLMPLPVLTERMAPSSR